MPQIRVLLVLALVLFVSSGLSSTVQAGQHCGAQGDWRSNLVPDTWPPKGSPIRGLPGGISIKPVQISKACMAHDKCYESMESTQKQCDRGFLRDMRKECERTYSSVVDLVQREACYSAAQGYYQAVSKYGGPAFATAQAKTKDSKKTAKAKASPTPKTAQTANNQVQAIDTPAAGVAPGSPVKSPEAAPPETKDPDNPLKWQTWGKLPGVGSLAAAHGILFAYQPATGQVFSSNIKHCTWKRLGQAPLGKFLAVGKGNLYLAGVLGKEVWISRTHRMKWKELWEAPGAGALAVCGVKLVYWQASQGRLLSSSIRKTAWQDLHSAKDIFSLAGNAGRIYRLAGPGLEVSGAMLSRLDWKVLGRAPANGALATDRDMLFWADPTTGEILTAPLP